MIHYVEMRYRGCKALFKSCALVLLHTSGKGEELLPKPCRLLVTDLFHHTLDACVDLRHIFFVVKLHKQFDVVFLKASPRRYVDVPEILRLITDASSAHLHRHTPYLLRDK